MSGIFATSSPTHRRRSSAPSKAPLLPVANPPGKGQCDVLMTGSLWKRRGWHRGSQKAKRFCVLVGPKNPSLRYYIQEKDFKAGLAFRKAYDLEGCSLSCPGRSSGNATRLVIVHPERGQVRCSPLSKHQFIIRTGTRPNSCACLCRDGEKDALECISGKTVQSTPCSAPVVATADHDG
jgi:hypothetical protein